MRSHLSLQTVIFISLIFSCSTDKKFSNETTISERAAEELTGNWIEVKKKNNNYFIVDCGTNPQSIRVTKDSIFEGGAMEDTWYEIASISSAGGSDAQNLFNIETSSKTVFQFSWIGKESGLSKWKIFYPGFDYPMERFYIKEAKRKSFKRVRGDNKDCYTDEDFKETTSGDEDKWVGTYKLYETIEKREHLDTFQYVFTVTNENIEIKGYQGTQMISNSQKNYKVSNDSLIVNYTENGDEEEFILVHQGNEYKISGYSIYMLNPPNNEYPLQKIK
ncbi:MAG TPA: hypothetical protein VF691_08525 [Cytophagaceae bacterium]|jgi:hypothetical protein